MMRIGSTRHPPKCCCSRRAASTTMRLALLFAARVGEPRRFDAPGVEELTLVQGLTVTRRESCSPAAGHELAPAVADALARGSARESARAARAAARVGERQRAGLEPLTQPLPVTKRYSRRLRGGSSGLRLSRGGHFSWQRPSPRGAALLLSVAC